MTSGWHVRETVATPLLIHIENEARSFPQPGSGAAEAQTQ
jgi:hypothetical protein